MVTSIVSTKRSLSFGVIVIAAVTSSLIFFAKVEARTNNAHRVLSITATVAASVAIAILYHQKHHNGFIEKADFGLVLSLYAAILCAVYEIILDVVPPVPSLADIFSITAYAFCHFMCFQRIFGFTKYFISAKNP